MYGDEVPAQDYAKGVSPYGVETVEPILRRGVLIDVAAHFRLEALPPEGATDAEVEGWMERFIDASVTRHENDHAR